MYKIILDYESKGSFHTRVFTYTSLEFARKELAIIKDRYISMGCRIHELQIYKVERIEDPEQI